MTEESGPRLSRFAVISAATEAWTVDTKSRLYVYDGVRFWRRRRRGARAVLIPGWQAPTFGWAHLDGCHCELCAPRPTEVRGAA